MRRVPSKVPSIAPAGAAPIRVGEDRAAELLHTEDQLSGERAARTLGVLAGIPLRAGLPHLAAPSDDVAECMESLADSTEANKTLADRKLSTARGPSPIKRGGKSRVFVAKLLRGTLLRRWDLGQESCSIRAVARHVNVNVKDVHEYTSGEKSAPWSLAMELPLDVVEEMNEAIVTARAGGRTWRWALSLIRRGLDWIEERGTSPADRHEVTQALREAQRRILDVLDRIDEESGR